MSKKIPQWKTKWDALVGDHKYIDIKGWYDWQEKSYTTDYIRDYFGKDEDPDYGGPQVRVMVRWMMDWLRRQRGRMRHTLPAQPQHLVTRMNLHPDDAKWAGPALVLLVECGFLLPTNECVRDQKYGKESKLNQRKGKEVSPPDEDTTTVEEPVPVPVKEPSVPKEKTPAELLAIQFFKLLGQPKKFAPDLVSLRWAARMDDLLENFTTEQLSSVIKFALEDDPFILEYLNKAADPMATFMKNIDSIRQSWEVQEKVSAARAKKANKEKTEVKTAPGSHGNKSGFKL